MRIDCSESLLQLEDWRREAFWSWVDDEFISLDQFGCPVPCVEIGEAIHSDQQEQFAICEDVRQCRDGIDRVGWFVGLGDFDVREAELLVGFEGEPEHVEAVFRGCCESIFLVRVVERWDEEDFINQSEFDDFVCYEDVAVVDWVERSSVNRDFPSGRVLWIRLLFLVLWQVALWKLALPEPAVVIPWREISFCLISHFRACLLS